MLSDSLIAHSLFSPTVPHRQDNVYPTGASLQFYKLFLDETIRSNLRRFDAIAIIEWDVIVADEKSFDVMYRAAFDALEPYWVKGASLAGINFHETALQSPQWCILGHINGNAIYSNSDPAFVEFLEFTLARWGTSYSYDVAMWATIADFPYSWPLWQRFSSKFVSSNLVSVFSILLYGSRTCDLPRCVCCIDSVKCCVKYLHTTYVDNFSVLSWIQPAQLLSSSPIVATQSSVCLRAKASRSSRTNTQGIVIAARTRVGDRACPELGSGFSIGGEPTQRAVIIPQSLPSKTQLVTRVLHYFEKIQRVPATMPVRAINWPQ